MSPTAVPSRITIDFRESIHPSRSWILGLSAEPEGRVDLLAFEGGAASTARLGTPRPTAMLATCACPDFCERDHENE